MRDTAFAHPTLLSMLWPADRSKTARLLVSVVAGSLLMTLSAKIQVPFWPVPMTMQTFVALMLGFVLGPRVGMAAVALYLAEGAMGLPVFAGAPERGLGLAYLAGPTGGYLIGFVFAAALTGTLARCGWDRRIATTALAATLGSAVIYLFGFAWLAVLAGPEAAFTVGVVPFVPAAALKIALATALLPTGWKFLKRD